jgi:hypothetical protein
MEGEDVSSLTVNAINATISHHTHMHTHTPHHIYPQTDSHHTA